VQFDFKNIGEAVGQYVSEKHPNSKMVYIQGLPGAGIVEAYTDGLTGRSRSSTRRGSRDMQPADWIAPSHERHAEHITSGKQFDVAFVNNEDMDARAQGPHGLGHAGKVAIVSTGDRRTVWIWLRRARSRPPWCIACLRSCGRHEGGEGPL